MLPVTLAIISLQQLMSELSIQFSADLKLINFHHLFFNVSLICFYYIFLIFNYLSSCNNNNNKKVRIFLNNIKPFIHNTESLD